ncbi:MAG: hypothetical protein ABS75_32435 [Pelagibacterium sp. SCN 63-23]|nr:MAG: hypothetical protein ABS75_32435 [Pelagibacterium sp. SCN 63-23]
MLRCFVLSAVLVCASTICATAHPHLFVDAKVTISFDAAGNVSAIRNQWTFDRAFSVWQVQGMDRDGDGTTTPQELQGLADENLVALADFGFYTSIGRGDEAVPLEAEGAARFEFANQRSTLTFTVRPQSDYPVGGGLDISVADPAYYVGITFAGESDVTVENLPEDCSYELMAGSPMADDVAAQLGALGPDVLQLPADLAARLRGSQQSIVVQCGP